jgi:hypothetical protein
VTSSSCCCCCSLSLDCRHLEQGQFSTTCNADTSVPDYGLVENKQVYVGYLYSSRLTKFDGFVSWWVEILRG